MDPIKWMMGGTTLIFSVVVVIFASKFFGRVDLANDANWPHHGQADVLTQMSRAMLTHDCTPEMPVTQTGELGERVYKYWEENKICQARYTHQKWIVGDQAVTGIFRCDLNGQTAEYYMTRFRYDNPYGSYWCQYKIFPTADDRGLGENFEVTWPTPWYDFTDRGR